jgi:hypothetical protein
MKRLNKAMTLTAKIIALAYVTVWPAGCTIIKEKIDAPIDHAKVELRVGETHCSQALNQLGPPAKVSSLNHGLAFLYEHTLTTENQLGLNLETQAIPWLRWFKLTTARGKAKRQALLLVFDEQGILKNQHFHEWGESLGGGSSIQGFIAVARLLDTSQFEDAIGPHQWGFSLLRPLPQTLNTRQSLDMGTSGLELQATPTKAGQHSLEMR